MSFFEYFFIAGSIQVRCQFFDVVFFQSTEMYVIIQDKIESEAKQSKGKQIKTMKRNRSTNKVIEALVMVTDN